MTTTHDAGVERARRIRSVPLVFGCLFVALGYGGIIAAADVDDAVAWLWPAALFVVGAAGLFATVRTGLDRRSERARRAATTESLAHMDLGPGDGTDVIGKTPLETESEDHADEPGNHGA